MSNLPCIAVKSTPDERAGRFAGAGAGRRGNPFSAHRIQPGAIEFLFDDGTTADALVERLRRSHWRGQIVGPHGSGKSTLLFALLPALRAAGCQIEHWVHRGGRLLQLPLPLAEGRREGAQEPPHPNSLPETKAAAVRKLILIDGFEQLGLFARAVCKFRARLFGWGLLVTSHRKSGLPTLCETRATPQLAQRIVARLLPPGDATILPADVARALQRSGNNLREALFALYDLYERRRSSAAGATSAPALRQRPPPAGRRAAPASPA